MYCTCGRYTWCSQDVGSADFYLSVDNDPDYNVNRVSIHTCTCIVSCECVVYLGSLVVWERCMCVCVLVYVQCRCTCTCICAEFQSSP